MTGSKQWFGSLLAQMGFLSKRGTSFSTGFLKFIGRRSPIIGFPISTCQLDIIGWFTSAYLKLWKFSHYHICPPPAFSYPNSHQTLPYYTTLILKSPPFPQHTHTLSIHTASVVSFFSLAALFVFLSLASVPLRTSSAQLTGFHFQNNNCCIIPGLEMLRWLPITHNNEEQSKVLLATSPHTDLQPLFCWSP